MLLQTVSLQVQDKNKGKYCSDSKDRREHYLWAFGWKYDAQKGAAGTRGKSR